MLTRSSEEHSLTNYGEGGCVATRSSYWLTGQALPGSGVSGNPWTGPTDLSSLGGGAAARPADERTLVYLITYATAFLMTDLTHVALHAGPSTHLWHYS